MKTTPIISTGVNGQKAVKELPAVGEIVVITTGNPRVGIKHTVARVTGHALRTIPGTDFCRYVIEAVTTTGEALEGTRYTEATAEQIAEFPADATAETPTRIVSHEEDALLTHSTACLTCRVSAETGRHCTEGMKLWNAYHRTLHDLTRAPVIAVDRHGNRRAFWDAESALAQIGLFGGKIVQAPAGMIEAAERAQGARAAARRAERAARAAARRR
ncbi:hypothetical protein ACFPC0_11105 [Streptomyces andamanensis]|uniref:Uncharacterized protein n=1 Tax=Streptomyces andamanensis TaxID=1565035 RepID=A0ABV8TCK4_9ACTN